MLINKKFLNQDNLFKLETSLSFLEHLNDVEIIRTGLDDNSNFYKIFFYDKLEIRCPFSLWIENDRGERIFFNIGRQGKDAAVYHYFEIISEDSINDLDNFIRIFLGSEVRESMLFCGNDLKKINYKILGKDYFPEHTYLHKSYFLCFKKRREIKKYIPWVSI